MKIFAKSWSNWHLRGTLCQNGLFEVDRKTGSTRGKRRGEGEGRTCVAEGYEDGHKGDLARVPEPVVLEVEHPQGVLGRRVELRERKERVLQRRPQTIRHQRRSHNDTFRRKVQRRAMRRQTQSPSPSRAVARRTAPVVDGRNSPQAGSRSPSCRARPRRRRPGRGRSSTCSPRTQSTAPRLLRESLGRKPR